MNFSLTSEQLSLRDSVERFTARDYDWERRLAVIRSPRGADRKDWARFAELGWLGAGLSEEAGGFGGGAVENAIVLEALGRALVGDPLCAHIIAVNILARSDRPEAAVAIERAVAGERRICLAHDEPGGRGLLSVRATFTGGRLTGDKIAVDGAPWADTLIVSAVDEFGALGLYLVDPEDPDVTRTTYRTLDNRRVSDIRFEAVATIGGVALTDSHDAGEVLETGLDWGVVALCAEALGAMEAALFMTRDYIQDRKQFGAPIGSFQTPQHAMADMLIETEMARSILFHAIGVLEQADTDSRRRGVSAAKTAVGRAGVAVAARAIQLHGGIGMTEEHRISHYYRRLFAIARLLGTDQQHLSRFIAATDRLDRPATAKDDRTVRPSGSAA